MIKCRFRKELIWHRNKVDPNRATRFIVVDTNSWSRLDGMDPLTEKRSLKIHLWDHHEGTGSIKPNWYLRLICMRSACRYDSFETFANSILA